MFELLKQSIRPEFLNRIDDIVMFTPLSESDISQIVRIQLNGINKLLAENGFQLDITDEAVNWIAKKGYNPQYGARPVKRVFQKQVLNELSKQLLAGTVAKSSTILVDVKEGKLVFEGMK